MKRRLFTLFVTLLVITTTAFANGVCIDGLYYVLNKEKLTAKVTCKNYDMRYNVNRANAGMDITIASIPENVKYKGKMYRVTSIGEYAFRGCAGLTSVEIPNSITSIEDRAFDYCTSLTSVTIPNSVTSIGDCAFDYCTSLTSVTIPNSVTSIGNSAFVHCTGLTSIEIPDNVAFIRMWTFGNCTGLTSVTIGNGVTSIGYAAFNGCTGLTSIEIPNSVTSIEKSAFGGCTGLTSIEIPNSVTSIEEGAFGGCKGLTTIEIPNSVTSIGKWAFSGCTGLTSVEIPNSITSIEDRAFGGCSGLTTITIPNSVTSIQENAFAGCPNLTIYTSSSADFKPSGISEDKIVRLSQAQILQSYYRPFSVYAKEYVEKGINEWQKKGEFERMADWQKRVNEQTRQQKIQALLSKAQNKYLSFHAQNLKVDPVLGKYDADNEVFVMADSKYGTMYITVPINEAQNFKNNWSSKKIIPQVQIYDDEVKISALTISMPNGKKYTYRNTDAVTYNLADIEYNFAPIELDLPKSSIPQSQQGQRNITTTKVKTGKSDVDTNIPSTTASNPNTFAIIFANEDYKNVASVPFAKNDGSIFQKYCQKTLGIPSSNIHYVENASFNDIRIQLAWLKDVCDAYEGKASVIVYYAGHGIPDEASKSAYLLPVDGDGRYVQSAYNIDEFYQKLGAMNAKSVTVFMDACFSGSKREDGMLASARGVAIKAKSGVPQGKMVVFSAAQGDETAYPNNDEGHGIFTYYLLKKLQETKGDVTLKDLGEYITTNVRRQSVVKNGKPQTPSVTPSSSIGTEWQNWKLKY